VGSGFEPLAPHQAKRHPAHKDTTTHPSRHSLARNHALIDGDKRLALAATIAFYGVNGRRLTLTNDEAYELVMNVAEGKLDSVDDIAAVLATATKPRRP
jgi:death-on-curing protein